MNSEERREKATRKLAGHITEEGAREVTQLLIEAAEDERELAGEIGCSYPAIKKWKAGQTPGDGFLPRIMSLALARAVGVEKVLVKEFFRFNNLCRELGVLERGRNRIDRFFSRLDREDVEIIRYLDRNGFAQIDELTRLVEAGSHSELLNRIKDKINRWAELCLGEPMMEFRRSAIDQETGRTITFAWWLTRAGMEALKAETDKDRLEVFDEGDRLTVLYSTGKDFPLEPEASISFSNGILSIEVEK